MVRAYEIEIAERVAVNRDLEAALMECEQQAARYRAALPILNAARAALTDFQHAYGTRGDENAATALLDHFTMLFNRLANTIQGDTH